MSRHKRSFGERFLSTLIAALCISAVVLALAIAVNSHLQNRPKDAPVMAVDPSTSSEPDVTPEPLTLRAELPTEEPVAEPTETPEPTATPGPTPEPYAFLPVYSRVETEEKVIAVTIDDCSHQDYLKAAISELSGTGAKLTLFPYGKSTMLKGMSEILRKCVFELGYEVENRTFSDAMLYRLAATDMAMEIWSADLAVDYALNMDYDMHLFRMRGGSGAVDVRTHEYLKQLGYDAIVNWTVSSTGTAIEALKGKLNPGYIYQFYSDKENLIKMVQFVRHAYDNGYRVVTVNELLGYDENTYAEPETPILSRTLPAPESYETIYVDHKTGDRAWQVLLIQSRLAELGYLGYDGADGVFGESTATAISEFQANNGMLGSGVADVKTQTVLFSSGAVAKQRSPETPTPAPTEPVPSDVPST